jgi:formylglycine-generating enzyme required for sulfatase activity
MSASASTRLRQLATQYHSGELNLPSYRRMRAELLDRLTNAESDQDEATTTLPQRLRPVAAAAPAAAPLPAAAPAPAPAQVAVPVAVAPPVKAPPAVAPPPAELPQPPTAKPKGAGRAFIVIALVAVLAGAAAWYFYLRPGSVSPGAMSEQSESNPESYNAINDFLAADDWSDEQIANLNARWATLPDDMRLAALAEPWYQNFVERVRSRVKERRALTATADRPGTVEGPLAALASSVGIDISSPDTILPAPVRLPSAEADAVHAKESVTGAQTTAQAAATSASPAAAKAAANGAATNGVAAPATAAASGKPGSSALRPASSANATAGAQQTSPDTSPDRCRIELVRSRKPRCRDALNIGGFGPYLAMVPGGEFQMGSKQVAQEQPVHTVRISKAFAIAEYEASQAEYQLFCKATGRACEAQPWAGDDLPVVRVNWQDARDYASWLSTVSGNTYRLATEAEWEFAARSGGSALYPSGEALAQTDAVFSHTDKLTAPWPRSRKINANTSSPNTFKLYHSIGNVREWVEDAWSASFAGAPDDGSARSTADSALRVVRGGAYSDSAPKLRFTTREGVDPATRDATTGFRVVREL